MTLWPHRPKHTPDVLRGCTGKCVSLLEGIFGYCGAVRRLGSHTLSDAIERFLSTVATVQRKALAEAVTDFIEGRKHLAESNDGKRSRHSPVYERHVAAWLNQFAATFPGNAVCDLTKDHLDSYIGSFKELSPNSRNDRRAVVKMFLNWCTAKDFLPQNHRLFEAVKFKAENSDTADIDFYRPKELQGIICSELQAQSWSQSLPFAGWPIAAARGNSAVGMGGRMASKGQGGNLRSYRQGPQAPAGGHIPAFKFSRMAEAAPQRHRGWCGKGTTANWRHP